ncbi:MAG: EAL domain-containing protein [Porticoccaceae bacterium]
MLNVRYQKDNTVVYPETSLSNHRDVHETTYSDSFAQEFKSPLDTMLGMLDLLLTTTMSIKQREYIEVACSSGRTLMSLVDSMLTFSEIKSGQIKLAEQKCHLTEILDEVIQQLAEKALKKSLNLGYVIEGDFPQVVITDAVKLQKILLQLLDNAIKFTHFGEVSIYVRFYSRTQTLSFVVHDKGIGIGKIDHQRIFDPFTQVNHASEKLYQGLGLGLTIARELSAIMKGELDLTSDLGCGSEFTLKIPIKAVEEKTTTLKNKALKDQSIMLVTRSQLIADSISQSVKFHGGRVKVLNSSQDALKLLSDMSATHFSVVVVDEDLGDIPLPEFFGLLQDSLNFVDTFPLILSNPYFSSYYFDDLQYARIEKPLLSSAITNLLSNQIESESDSDQSNTLLHLDCGNSANVLVVDDNRINQQVIEAMLMRLNCRHQVASNGKKAVEKVVYGDFDLVLMDCNMPVLSGYAATRQIRVFEEQDAGKLPIIGMATNDTDIELCMAAGMTDVIKKPLSSVSLRELLSKWTFFPEGKLLNAINDSSGRGYKVIHQPPANSLSYNPSALDQLVTNVGSSIANVIKNFCQDMEHYIKMLRSAINQKNESEICFVAHTLKGAAKNFGAEQLVRLSAQLEEKVRRGELQEIHKILPRIETAANTLSSELNEQKKYLNRQFASVKHFESKDLVMVVDDDRTSRVVLAEALRNGGCEVDEARDAKEALELCSRCMPDLILIDAIMPGLDGYRLCQTIRNMPLGATIPILIITASNSEDAVSMAFSAEATDFINKPVNTSVIQKRVNHLIATSKTEQYMKQFAYHDSLTGLPNRTNLMQHLQLMVNQSNIEKALFAVLFLDLDHFKMVNDTMGHDVGDLLLKAVANRLSGFLREQDFIARLGGDEFTIVVQDVKNLQAVEDVARQICESFREPFVFLRRKILVTTSIGISVFPSNAREISDLLKQADTAMFKAKKYRDRFYFYQPGMASEINSRVQLQKDLQKALECNELELYYQPKIAFKNGALQGAEGLLRWIHPAKGTIRPREFIEIAENSELITKINNWVLEQGVRQLQNWLQAGYRLPLSLNISLSGSSLSGLYKKVSALLKKYPATKGLIELEVTENALITKPKKMGKELVKIRDLGVSIALDDFGSGFSSLNHLKEIPVDVLKIDRLFIRGIETNPEDQAIVKSIVNLARELNTKTVAEGVETMGQKAILAKLNCHLFQGFLISKPLAQIVFTNNF